MVSSVIKNNLIRVFSIEPPQIGGIVAVTTYVAAACLGLFTLTWPGFVAAGLVGALVGSALQISPPEPLLPSVDFLALARDALARGQEPTQYIEIVMQDRGGRCLTHLPLMHQAAWLGDEKLVESMVHSSQYLDQVKISCWEYHNYTPLHIAAMRGHLGIVQLIVERVENLDPQARGTHATPLHLAIHNGHKDTAQLLVSRGSDMSCRANLRGPGEDFLSAEEMMDKRGWDLALL